MLWWISFGHCNIKVGALLLDSTYSVGVLGFEELTDYFVQLGSLPPRSYVT